MKNFLISAGIDIVLIFASYFVFKNVISGPTRHRIYEKFIRQGKEITKFNLVKFKGV